MVNERREQERFSLNLNAKVSYRNSSKESSVIEMTAADISSGGAFLKTKHPFPMASKIQIEFNLAYEDLKKLKFILSMETLKQLSGKKIWISATGIVIRQEKNGVAIIFDTDYQLTPMKMSREYVRHP